MHRISCGYKKRTQATGEYGVEAQLGEIKKEDYIGSREIVLNSITSPFLLPAEAARFLRIQLRTLDDYRTQKTGPVFRRHGGRILYHEIDLQNWSEKQLEKT